MKKLAIITTSVLMLVALGSPAKADLLGNLVNDAGDLAGNVVKLKKDKSTGENKVEFFSILKKDDHKSAPAKPWVNPDKKPKPVKVKKKVKKKTTPAAPSIKQVAAPAAPVAVAPVAAEAAPSKPASPEPPAPPIVQPAPAASVAPPPAAPAQVKAPEPEKKKGFDLDL